MPTSTINIEARIKALNAVVTDAGHQKAIDQALKHSKGDLHDALEDLKSALPAAALARLEFAHSLANFSGDNVHVVRALSADPDVSTLRDVALNFNIDKLAAQLKAKDVPAGTPGATAHERAKSFATSLNTKLFAGETSAVLQRMIQNSELPIADVNVRSGVASFLKNQPGFNIRTTSVYTALQHSDAFKGIADEHRAAVVETLKTLQRVQAISPVPEAVPALMKANLASAFRIAEIPESTFLKAHTKTLGEQTARQVYTNAINTHIRNEHALMTMRDTLRGSGLAIIDGQQTREERVSALQAAADQKSVPLNLSTLFGSLDYCECEDCLSVYSPAAYFVELLQFLRNNNLGPDPATGDPDPAKNKNIQPGIVGTPLEKLFRRRPDLGCLELTCENTFTVLPYIDLVNEVMESFVVHVGDYHNSTTDPKQATLEAFNVEGETSSELLAIPQHINYEAYCILKSAVYPFTLPYHQPIDATRIFLKYLGTSRWELLDTFRTPTESCPSPVLTPAELQQLRELHQAVIDRAVDADFLGMTQEEYIILTQQAFWPKDYFDLTQHKSFSVDDYRKNIGVRQVCEYYGYVPPSSGTCDAEMVSPDEKAQVGLPFVKKQFLPRTGIQYTDLVELLKTRFVNPGLPQGHALTLLENIRFSYRYLQTLLDKDPKVRFDRLIAFLESHPSVPTAISASNLCNQRKLDTCEGATDIRNWVLCYFDRIATLIVLESGEGPRLPFEGEVFDKANANSIGMLLKDGTIVDPAGAVIGHVTFDGQVIGKDDQPFIDQFGVSELQVIDISGKLVGLIDKRGLQDFLNERPVTWLPARDTCDLDKVRLIHLDGTPVLVPEYDRIHRFLRLWRKLGWTIDEVDKALSGLARRPGAASDGGGAAGSAGGGTQAGQDNCHYVGFDTFVDICPSTGGAETCHDDGGDGTPEGCPETVSIDDAVTPEFLHQLRAVKTLLDQTGLPLPKLLALWADISTEGTKSLYATLFLTHNLLAIDNVFQADAHGSYLTKAAKITDHLPVLMAALKLKADDIAAIMKFAPVTDSLTLRNVSILYRYSLLAKILHVRISLLKDLIGLFGNPFKSAWNTLRLLETWGKMEDAGFTFWQLDYLILDQDDLAHQLAPSQKTILQLAKTIFDGLNAIDRDHKDIPDDSKADATDELIRSKAGLLFDTATVEQIVSLLEGTTVYTTNAPAGLTISIPDSDPFGKKLKYSEQKTATPPAASIQVTGILTTPELLRAKSLSNNPAWPDAVERAGKQAKNVFNDVLAGIFTDKVDAQKTLLAGDFSNPSDPQDSANTAPGKRFYFLQQFLPFLRERLSQRLIVDASAGAASLPGDVTNELLTAILHVGTPQVSAMKALQAIKTKPAGAPAGWQGYLIPTLDAEFTFVAVGDTRPAPLTLDGQTIPFTFQQEDPSNVRSSDPAKPTKLKSGKLYRLVVADRPAEELKWKTPTSPATNIPPSSLLPDFSSQTTTEIFTKLYKAALLVNGFNLSVDEVSYLQIHGSDFDGLDFNGIGLKHWLRVQAYADLRNNLPRTDLTLIGLFTWASQPAADVTKLSKKIAEATAWKPDVIDKLIAPDANDAKDHFNLNRLDAFRNEVNLVKLRQAIAVAEKIGVDIDRLFDWATPGSKFWASHQVAEDIRKATRARFDETDWEQVVKPLNDQLRENQKQALISYLLVQPDLLDWGAIDADSLFEFFLIDVQMGACMETSRIKQAISSVQLFIQRCLLGLEERQVAGLEVGVLNGDIDRGRWDWMQRYRLWEANRKVFLYPENWIASELRDDKSQFYKELESALLQKDVNTQTVQDALQSYLFRVDEVANLTIVGLFRENEANRDGIQEAIKLHVFGRTRNAPYLFFYRYFHEKEGNWYPWEQIGVDIPTYDQENNTGSIAETGTYLIPVVLNKRLLIFFPQFTKRRKVLVEESKWEIKLAWSEHRNGKWTPKQLSAEAIYSERLGLEPVDINSHQFIPRVILVPHPVLIVTVDAELFSFGAFLFSGSQLSLVPASVAPPPSSKLKTHFHYTTGTNTIHSLQAINLEAPPGLFTTEPFFDVSQTSVTLHSGGAGLPFSHTFVHELLGALAKGGLPSLFDYYLNHISDSDKDEAYGADAEATFQELKRANSLYNWEPGFHVVMLLAGRLVKAQQFEQALEMFHYVLNPFAEGAPTDKTRFWQFPPFKKVKSDSVLQDLFLGLQPGQPNQAVEEWRNKPFQPHFIARRRPAAYMKWVAMSYISALIEWGDYLFRQDTIESINQATQLYVLAAHTYGPRGQKIPKRGKVPAETYNALIDKWDAFGNAMVELELVFPFSNQTNQATGTSNGLVGLANIFGFATTLYFCIPDNPELTKLRDTIDDRLFKIRHCENIAGVVRQLPLFEPPIDPALLVQAAAQGLSLSSVLNDLNSPMPNYRFPYLLQKALEMCNELKSLGSAFLSAKEKGDSEALARLRAVHESAIQSLVIQVRTQQLNESESALVALQQSRKGPAYRLQHFLKLIGDASTVPEAGVTFAEIANQIEPPRDEGGLKLISLEKEEMDKAAEANDKQEDVGRTEVLAGIFHAIPNVSFPLGPGVSSSFGGSNLGSATQAVARANQVVVGNRTFSSTNAGRKASFLRQLQDRVQQANVAGYEIMNIDKQALTQQIRIEIAQLEIANQQQQIDNAKEIEDFLRNKYSNQELYAWMTDQVRGLYYQSYTLAYDLAKRAEKVFRFERGLTTSSFIQFGYWDPTYDGLLAGERLFIGLKQLETAYQEKRGYDFEIVKNISLQQLNPLELTQLRETGRCEFALPEVLFDMGYPGHFMRRIKSVAMTFACHVGPPTSMNCVLRLMSHEFRMSPTVAGEGDYPKHTDEDDPRFSSVNVPITAIAVSTGQNDSGVFDLNFRDERYIPFEGAGVISKWQIQLPKDFREFDYESITDVVMHLRYTALDGGDKLRVRAEGAVTKFINGVVELSREEGLFALFDLRRDFPNGWYKSTQPSPGATERVIVLGDVFERLPIFTKGRKSEATDVYLFTSPTVSATSLTQGTDTVTLEEIPAVGEGMKSFVAHDVRRPMSDWRVKVGDLSAKIETLWLVVRYTLK